MADDLVQRVEHRVEELGYELVELEQTGSKARPILRVRIDKPDSEAGRGVTVGECADVSRALEPILDAWSPAEGRYLIEVSSPGVERPLVRARDFERFAGREVALKGYGPLAGRARRLEGELLGLDEDARGEPSIRLRLESGEEVRVPRSEVARAHLIFRWDGGR